MEFAIIVTLLFALVFGIIGFGRAVWMQQALTAASREASRYGVAAGTASGAPQYLDCSGIRREARQRAPDVRLSDADIAITYKQYAASPSPAAAPTAAPTCTGTTVGLKDGDRIVVKIEKKLDVDLPLVPLGDVTLGAQDERTIYNGIAP